RWRRSRILRVSLPESRYSSASLEGIVLPCWPALPKGSAEEVRILPLELMSPFSKAASRLLALSQVACSSAKEPVAFSDRLVVLLSLHVRASEFLRPHVSQ